MANRAVKHIKEKSVFIAVGAAHLGGEKGLLELLRKKGFKVVAAP
ncbi:MAG: TraB/GumN family protein [Flavobacteriales bacterium]